MPQRIGFDACSRRVVTTAVATLTLGAWASRAVAQAELQGRTLADGNRHPLRNAEVAIPKLGLRALSDSLGRYRLAGIPRGEHLIVARAVGFRPDSTVTAFDGDEALVSDVVLKVALNELPTVAVRAATRPVPFGTMAGYEERKAAGIGRFLDRELLAKDRSRRLSDIIASNVPGLTVHRGNGSRAWAASTRTVSTAKCAMCPTRKGDIVDGPDLAAGAPLACYSDVYLDGILIYDSTARPPPPLFNLNSMTPDEIQAIEVYTSAAQIPAQFNKTAGGCGVMLIWSRTGR